MCGISGLFDTKGMRAIDVGLLRKMTDAQQHRGPDESGFHLEAGLGLGHRRLSVIDLASGRQPLANEDGTVLVCYNGEIYNYLSLMAQLQARGHVFRTRCDTEVIVHAWEEWGAACVERFRGMFAFALWDRRQRLLFLARDRLGVKPLFYTMLPDGMLAFGSELKSLTAIAGLPRAIDPCAVEEYFAFGYVPDPRTIYAGVHKLAPGHILLQAAGWPLAAPRRYWDVPFARHSTLSLRDAEEELVERLRDAVRVRLVADVPLGAFLSGGVDSSAVVAMMAGLDRQAVNTCSITFRDPAFDESAHARTVAALYGTAHHADIVDSDDYGLLDTLAALYDEPYADSSAIPTYRVCQLARRRVTVALSGDGGDENFAGYRRYRLTMAEHAVRARVPLALRRPLFGTLGKYYPKADWAPRMLRGKSTFESLARDLVEGYFHGICLFNDGMRKQLFSARFQGDLQGHNAVSVLRDHASRAPTADPLSLIQYLDMKTYLPGDILTKVDRASMAHALEVRVPLLDHEFVEWVSGLPPAMKLQGNEGKYILKRSLAAYLPQAILYRRKMGFGVPLAAWFRGPLRERVRASLLGPVLADSGIFDVGFLGRMVEQHLSGRRDYSAPIWALLMFETFLRREQAL